MPPPDYPFLDRATEDTIAEVFADLNERLFLGALPSLPVILRAQPAAWGACVGRLDPLSGDPCVEEISLCPMLVSPSLDPGSVRQAVRIVLGHEMVHAWQWLVDGPRRIARDQLPRVDHGPSFRAWRTRFAKAGIPLKTGYRSEDLFRGSNPPMPILVERPVVDHRSDEAGRNETNSIPMQSEPHLESPFPGRR